MTKIVAPHWEYVTKLVLNEQRRQRVYDRERREIMELVNAGHIAEAMRLAQSRGHTDLIVPELRAQGNAPDPDLDMEFDGKSGMMVSGSGKDGPTRQQRMKSNYEAANFKKSASRAKRNTDVTVWETYFTKGQITWRQHRAAEMYWSAWYNSGMEPRLVASYSDSGSGSSDPFYAMPASVSQAHHRGILRRYNGILGPRQSALVSHVIVMDRPARTFGLTVGKSKHDSEAGMELFREAMDTIADLENLPNKKPRKQGQMEDPD